jgi:hypothetical protein
MFCIFPGVGRSVKLMVIFAIGALMSSAHWRVSNRKIEFGTSFHHSRLNSFCSALVQRLSGNAIESRHAVAVHAEKVGRGL